jgi:hypothetical protein
MAPIVRRIQFLWDAALKAELADSFDHFHAVAFSMFDILNAACIFCSRKEWPRKSGAARRGHGSDQLANRPASIRVANSTARGRHHDRRDDRHAWHHCHAWRHSATVVDATVVAVATAAAIWAAVEARSTATSDRNCQAGLGLFERRERHGLGGGNEEETDADGDSESKKLCHSFLLVVA